MTIGFSDYPGSTERRSGSGGRTDDDIREEPREPGRRMSRYKVKKRYSLVPVTGSVVFCARNQTHGTVLCARAELASGFQGRSRGLLGRAQLSTDEGMLFEAEPFRFMWMHTLFMTFPIDIVFLGPGNIVIRIRSSLRPWRFSPLVWGAHKAIELSAGAAARAKTTVGDYISLVEI